MAGAATGRVLVPGRASGDVVHADLGLSFWGGVDATTGLVMDRQHPLCGQTVAGKVLAIPSGRGSCTGSAVLLELLCAGKAPAAMIFREEETILPIGAMLGEALFGLSMPMARVNPEVFARLGSLRQVRIHDDRIESDGGTIARLAPAPTADDNVLPLSDDDRDMLAGAQGEARQIAMRIILAAAALQESERLIDVRQAHLDCCIHTGPASVAIAERFRERGGRVKVPTTLNAISIDRRQWRALGVPEAYAVEVRRQTDAYVAMGAEPTFTCAPYLLDGAPRAGDPIGWAESNAVAFANSVIGARTDKYPDYLDLCIALTGRAPLAGCHLPEQRRAQALIAVEAPQAFDDALYPMLGYLAGELSPNAIPVLTGLQRTQPTRDDLKSFAAAFATTSAAPMFHIAGVTPEAQDADAIPADENLPKHNIRPDDLRALWRKLNGDDDAPVAVVAIGNPHASFEEMERLAALCAGRRAADGVSASITTGRAMHERAVAAGIAQELERFGFRIIRDTCWCMIGEPVIPPGDGALLTNSGKYVHYGPGLTGRRVRFASLGGCVEAAVTGRFDGASPPWL